MGEESGIAHQCPRGGQELKVRAHGRQMPSMRARTRQHLFDNPQLAVALIKNADASSPESRNGVIYCLTPRQHTIYGHGAEQLCGADVQIALDTRQSCRRHVDQSCTNRATQAVALALTPAPTL